MKRHTAKEWTVEEFDDWAAASDRFDAVAKAADEEGGPSLSLVPATERNEVWPTDSATAGRWRSRRRRPAASPRPRSPPPPSTASRSRTAASASPAGAPSGSACSSAISPRPARSISPAPPRGSPRARPIGCGPARRPSPRPGTWRTSSPSGGSPPSPSIAPSTAASSRSGKSGELVAEKRVPSDRLLMWLLARLDPRRFAAPWELRKDGAADPQAEARESFPALLDALSDTVSE